MKINNKKKLKKKFTKHTMLYNKYVSHTCWCF